nr:hypothetical protein [Actinomyces oris]
MDIRPTEPTTVPDARTTYPDWSGTSCAEDSFINTSGDLYELAGLDHDRWQILAIDLDAYSHHGKDPSWNIYVYAADRIKFEVTQTEEWDKVVAQRGGIPVVKVLLHDVNADDVIKCMKLMSVQLRARSTSSYRLIHTANADHPDQD